MNALPRLLSLALLALIAGCASSPQAPERRPPDHLRIAGFRQGLIDIDARPQPRIAEEGKDFTFRENGHCQADGKAIACMWHGFEFDYEAPAQRITVECETVFDQPVAVVEPATHFGNHLFSHHWRFELEGGRGHYLHPQYASRPDSDSAPATREHTACFYGGENVLDFSFTLRAPA